MYKKRVGELESLTLLQMQLLQPHLTMLSQLLPQLATTLKLPLLLIAMHSQHD